MSLTPCSIPDCGKPRIARDLCRTHYNRVWKAGGLTPVRSPTGAAILFVRNVALRYDGRDCLPWPFPLDSKSGYGQITVSGRHYNAHRYICELAHGTPPSPQHEAAHSCGKGHLGCVAPRHLSWKTAAENQADRLLHGTDMRGQKHWAAKLTDQNIREIRALSCSFSRTHLAKAYGVSATSISYIVMRKTWSHIQ